MKLIKRSVSVLLAVLMIFSSFSLLATASDSTVEDTNPITTKEDYNWAIDTVFYRQDRKVTGEIIEGSWIPTENVMRGETVKARVFMKTDFPLANSQFFFLYPSNFLTMDVTNCPTTSGGHELLAGGINGFDGNFAYSTECDAVFQEMVDEGYLTEDDIIDRGWIYVNMDIGDSPYQLDGSQWLFEFEFTVNNDATSVGQLFLSAECIADNENYMGRTDIMANPYSDDYNDGDLSSWTDMTFGYTLNDTDANSTIDLYSSLTFDAGEGKFADGTSTFTVENYEVQATTPISDFPGAPVLEGEEFLGWVLAEKYESYTEEDLINDEYVLNGNYNYQHEEATYKAVYTTENTVTVNVHYYDLVKKEDVVVDTNKYSTKTGYAVEIIADEDIPAEIPAETTYIAFSKLPAIEHYKFDSTNALNVLKVESAAENGASTLDVYYIPETYTVTFDPANGGAVATNSDVVYYTELTSPAAPEKSGWKFTEWLGDDADKSTLGAEQKFNVTGNVNYVAQYESAETTVAIKVKYIDRANNNEEKIVNHATVNTIAGYTVALTATDEGAENTTYYLIENLPAIEHYEYDADNTTTTVTAAADGTSEIIVVYKPMQYTATFTGAETMGNVDYYTELTVPAGPVEEGKTFVKWVGSDGTELVPGTVDAPATFILTGDVIYTAQYDDIIYNTTLSFSGESGVDYPATATLPTVAPGKMGDEIVLTDPVAVAGWEFNGWNTPVGAVEKDGKYYYGTSDVTVTGSWTHTVYYVNYWLDEAKTIQYSDTVEYFYGEPIELIDGPTDDELKLNGVNGKTFVEWICDYETMPAENVDIVADFNSILYTVNVRYTDGTTATLYRYYGEQVTIDDLPDTEDIEGYTFSSWTINGKKEASLPYTVVGTTSIVGNFDIHKWDLYYWIDEDAYNAFGTENEVDPIMLVEDLEYGSEILNIPANPEKTGHEFLGWDTDPAASEMGDSDMHFYGEWRTETYTVIWDNDGVETTETYSYGSVLNIPAPTKTGYTLTGWSGLDIAEEGDTTMPDVGDNGATVTYTAVWVANNYTATFNANGGTFSEGKTTITKDFAYGTDITAPEIPTRSGYAFGGWEPELGKMDSVDGKTFNAQWTAGAVNYTIETYTMDTTGAYGDPVVETKASTTDAPVSVTPETKEGFTVDNAASVLSGTVAADGSTTLKVYYIRDQYTLKTVVDGKETSTEYYYGAAVSVATPSKTGHTFSGWTWTNDEGATVAAPATMPAYNVTASATFKANVHDVIYMVDGKEYDRTEDVAYGTAVTAIAAPTKAGYTFSGWDKTSFTMPDEDVTVSGTFTANEGIAYTVKTFKMNSDGTTYAETSETLYGTAGQPATAATPDEEGFTFNAEKSTITGTIEGDGSLVLEVYYDRNKITVDVNGEEDEYFYDDVIEEPETPVDPNGGEFKGWEDEDGEPVEFPYNVPDEEDGAITITPVYYYTVKFVADNADVLVVENRAGTAYTVPEASKTGYTFTGWTLDGADAGLTVGGEATIPVGGATYVAAFTANSGIAYTVKTFKMNLDGTTYAETSETLYGTAGQPATAATPDEEGFTFNAEKSTITGTIEGDGSLVLEVYYDRNKITVDVNGEEDEYFYGEEIQKPTDPTPPTGEDFVGWVDEDGDPVEFPYTVPDEEDAKITITPVFEKNEYTVTYYLDSNMKAEEVVFTYTSNYGQEYNIPTPDKTGHTFVAWVNAADASDSGLVPGNKTTVPVNGGTYYATWTVNTVKLTYRAGTNATFEGGATTMSYDVAYGTAQAEWPVPDVEVSRPGYTFGGWNMSSAPATMGTTPVNISAIWNEIDYTVTWKNGDAEPVVEHYIYDEEIIAPELEEREGWTFNGWLEADGETTFNEGDTMGEKSLVYTAQWEGNEGITYTIYRYFAPTEGTEWMDSAEAEALYGKAGSTALTGKAGELAKVDTAAEAVDGFYINEETSTLSATINGDGTTALVIYYLREKVNVTVKDPDGETYYEGEVDFGDEITVEDPTKEGHTFIKWVDEDGNTVKFPMTAPSEDIVIKPEWTVNKYDITFVDDNGDVLKATEEVEYGSTIVAPADPEKEGYNFAYWRDKETKAVMPATMPAKDVTYEAFYTAGEDTTYYIEVYMMDTNGDYTMASQTIAAGTTGDPISITPGNVEGCTYDATLSVLTGIITAEGTTLKVYYARNKYTVTFNSGDGVFADDATVVGPTSVYFGAAIPVPAEPTREGYDFAGWDAEVPAAMPADNLTFNATWTEAEYTITYIINDTKEVVPYKFGAAVEPHADPVVEGMTFLKWDTEAPATMPAEDLIIIALFETAVYKVTFTIDGETYEEIMVKAGSEIPLPAVEPTKEYHTFAGWQNVPATMPAKDLVIEGKFDRDPVKLVPYDDNATTVIDDENKAIYGLAEDMEEGLLRAAYLRVEGDGYFTVTPSKAASGRVICGTGAVVELYDRMGTEDESDDVLKETYTIVIFGDLNGDARISNTDYSIAQAEVDMFTFWSDPMHTDYNLYKTMAADFNGDTMISVGEASSIERAVLGTVDFDQTTGTVIRD